MTIETAYQAKADAAQNNSFTLLAERCEKSAEYPHGLKPAAACAPEETIVLALPGTLSKARFRECNGFLKRFDNFVHQTPAFANVRCLTAISGLGDYFYKDDALELLKSQRLSETAYNKALQALPLAQQRELSSPAFVDDIYQAVIAPRISTNNGTIRRPLAQALRNIRNLNIVTYCFGAYTALKLEQQTKKHLQKLGYSPKEQSQILSQLLVLNYSANTPLGLSEAKSINIASLSDLTIHHENYIKELVHFGLSVANIPPLYLPTKHGGTFYCAAYKKNTENVITTIEINEWFDKPLAKPKEIAPFGEHSFLGFEELPKMSRAAHTLQTFGKNILYAALKNATTQPKNGYTPLPSTKKLATNTLRQKLELIKLWHCGRIIQRMVNKTDKETLMQNSFAANIKTITLD